MVTPRLGLGLPTETELLSAVIVVDVGKGKRGENEEACIVYGHVL